MIFPLLRDPWIVEVGTIKQNGKESYGIIIDIKTKKLIAKF